MALNLSNAVGAPIGDTQGIGTIANDDAAPDLSVGNASVTEGNSGQRTLTFNVSLTGDTDLDATVDFATAGVTATAGTDYVDGSGTLTIPAGDGAATIAVTANGDTTFESDETLSVTLSDPTDALLVDGTAVGTIHDDDKAPTVLTVGVARAPRSIAVTGVMERARSGLRVTATLFRKTHGGAFVKITGKTVRIRHLGDRDHDGKPDGSYGVSFARPRAKGTYKMVVRFKGTSDYKPCSRARVFNLAAT
jgi:hypothetical protein